jgi:hypothetical protein
MIRTAAILLVCLSACGPFFRGGKDGDETERLTLCVANQAVARGNIIARAALVRYDVMPGEEVCKPVIATGPAIELRATTTGGGLSGPLSYAVRLDVGRAGCWRWRLTDSPASAVDLLPCEFTDEPDTTAVDTVPADSSADAG